MGVLVRHFGNSGIRGGECLGAKLWRYLQGQLSRRNVARGLKILEINSVKKKKL